MEPLGATKPAAAAGSGSAIKHLRWWIAGLLFFATFFNYLDRQALSVAAPTICKALKFTETDYAHIVMAFLVAYMLMQPLTGWFVDRIGVRIGFAAAVVLWSLACMGHALAQGVRSFVLFRFLLGAAEAANFPAGIRAVGEWFPPSERSGATGIFTAGGSLGAIIAPPVGATQCNFAYSRETGLIEELFLNNLHRNPTWCPEGWNLELETLVRNDANLDLFLNSAVCEVAMNDARDRIASVKAYCAIDETWHQFAAPYFADCSGDGVAGSLAGAPFRMGVEARSEFGEPMGPAEATGDTMGMSLHMHARDAGRPMPFTRPEWVRLELKAEDFGPYRPVCEHFFPDTGGFWWLEWGGALDTVHDSTKIKEEVQRITLAVWDYLKNRSPLAEKLATYELDWMGAIPGKRESRRFEGDHILTMNDIDQQAVFEDAVAYGGWGFDHHPPGGFHDKVNPSTHQYLRGPHNVPLRSLYSRTIGNLFFAGRNLSATHYALSSTRVMLTCAQLGEAVGMAACHAVRSRRDPRSLAQGEAIRAIQRDLLLADHHIHALDLPIACVIARPGWHFLILGTNPDLAVHMTGTPPGKRWYYPRPADPIRPNPFSTWTARTLKIGMTRAVDADGASVVSPDWNEHARNSAAASGFLNFAYLCRTTPEQAVYDAAMVVNGHGRPTRTPNLWVSAASSFKEPEWIELSWETSRTINEIQLLFDSALHFHFWQSWQGYPVRSVPSIVRDYRLIARHADGSSSTLAEVTGNFQRNRRHRMALEGITGLRLEILATNGLARAQVYEIRVLGDSYGAPQVP
jgi:hypothetical protein